MKFSALVLSLVILSLSINSCRKESSPEPCIVDPRKAVSGTYNMTDSVFFLGSFSPEFSILDSTYQMTITYDSLGGDTILMENIFSFGLDLMAVYNSEQGTFIIPPQEDDQAMVSGSGTLSSANINYIASYDDNGYTYIGQGTKD